MDPSTIAIVITAVLALLGGVFGVTAKAKLRQVADLVVALEAALADGKLSEKEVLNIVAKIKKLLGRE